MNTGLQSNNNASAIGCNLQNNPYMFRRTFWVDVATNVSAILNIGVRVDDHLENVYINGIGLGMNTNCMQTGGDNTFPPTAITLVPGLNTLDIEVWNRSWNGNGTSTMALDVNASVNTGANLYFIRNEYYVSNTDLGCNNIPNNKYIPIPTFYGTCVAAPNNSGTVSVTNYDPNYTYTVDPGAIVITNSFVATVGNTYTISVSDALGCSVTSSFTMINTVNPPVVSISPSQYCAQNGWVAYITGTASAGTPAYTFGISPMPPGFNYNGNTFNAGAGVGFYTVSVSDALGCTGTGTFNVGSIFNVTLNGSSGPPCINLGGLASLTATPSSWAVMGTYSLNGGAPQPSNQFWVNVAGIYTVTATDIYGCTATATCQVNNSPIITNITSNNAPCAEELTAFSPTNGLQYYWNDNPNLINFWINNPNPANPYILPYQFPPVISTYTVVAVDAIGCTGSSTYTWTQNPYCCAVNDPIIGDKFSSNVLYNNGTASAIIAFYGNNVITTNNTILLDGDIQIDQDITFLNCPNIKLTYNTRLILQYNKNITIDNSTLKAQCNYLWRGILALSNTSKVTVINNSVVRDMKDGILLAYGAKIEADHSQFLNNFISMNILNAPVGYNQANGSCKITDNYFGHVGNVNLLYPYSLQTKGEKGIQINNCKEVQIGNLNNNLSSYNKFENLYNGIHIIGGSMSQTENYYILNNRFYDININWSNNENDQYYKTTFWSASTHRGSAIYSSPMTGSAVNTHTLTVESGLDQTNFLRCDKAIYTRYTSANVQWNYVIDCVMGFMYSNATGQVYNNHDNYIYGTYRGIQADGDVKKSILWKNFISTKQCIAQNLYSNGITVNFVNPTAISSIYLNENEIRLFNRAGTGITFRKTNENTIALKNTIRIMYGSWGDVDSTQYVSAGIYLEKCNRTQLKGNYLIGAEPDVLLHPNKWTGVWLNSSIFTTVDCNHFSFLRKGLFVVSNCAGDKDQVKGNDFYAHGRGMTFHDLGTQGTLGNIGSATADNHNVFVNAALFGGGYGVYRNGITAFGGIIYTTQFNQLYSGAPFVAARYNVNPFTSNPYQCPANLAMIPFQNLVNEGISEEDALAIIYDSVQYVNFEEVAQWMQEQELLAQLAGDTAITEKDTAIQNFYNTKMQTNSGILMQIDKELGKLNDSTLAMDSLMYYGKIAFIDSLNNSINSSNTLEMNMKQVNGYQLKWICGGIDSLTQLEQDSLGVLAKMCPFVGGTAVYKARSIYHEIEPIDLDDIVVCNAAGVYKNGNTTEDEEIIDPLLLQALDNKELNIYPNPANTQITVDYSLNLNEEGMLVMYDMLGREYMRTSLLANVSRVTINISSLPKGLYLCKYMVNNSYRSTKKLVIE